MPFRKRTLPGHPTPAITAAKFREYVDFLVELFRLDPELPEVASLKEQAEAIVAMGAPCPDYFLGLLNPDGDVRDYEGVKILEERWFGHVLQPWSLARHHCPRLDDELTKIVVDGQGTHLFTSFMREHEVFCVRGAAINPHRLADPGNRYQIACEIIRQFTGNAIDYVEQVGSTWRIIASKDMVGSWKVEFDRVSAASG